MHASKTKLKSLGYNLDLCMRQLHAWLLACKVTLICDQTRVISQMFFLEIYMVDGERRQTALTVII